jgi:hypothetical protein
LQHAERFEIASEQEIQDTLSGGWKEFYQRFPDSAGVMAVARPVLAEDGKSALIYAENHCGGTCGVGTVYLLEKAASGWRITIRSRLWDS